MQLDTSTYNRMAMQFVGFYMGISVSIADPKFIQMFTWNFQVHVGHVRPTGDMAWRKDGTRKKWVVTCGDLVPLLFT